jgi:hypothetical protein
MGDRNQSGARSGALMSRRALAAASTVPIRADKVIE